MERVAFLTLDSLSGDDSLAWMRTAVPNIATSQLAGVGRTLPMRGDASVDGAALGATQLVHGYFDRRSGKLHFEFSVEDSATHKMRVLAVDGDALTAAGTLARLLEPGARPFSTENAQAAEAWGAGKFELATELDLDFGAAWRDLAQSQARQPELAAATLEKALARTSLRGALEKSQIGLLSAQLRGDRDAASRSRAELVKLVPNDAAMVRKFAEEESSTRNFGPAVQFYQLLAKLDTGDLSVGNQLGYAQFFAGDLEAARRSFQQYGKLPGQQANALDSEGEVLFMAGKFAEAEKAFEQAHAANAAMLEGSDLLKAAHARWLAGDLPGADLIFERYMKYRSGRGDAAVKWRRAAWEFATKREGAGLERLRRIQGPAAAMAQAELQVLLNRDKVLAGLMGKLAELEASYRATAPGLDGMVRVLYARALLGAGRKGEAEKLAELWPLPEVGEESLRPLLYPLYFELKKELGK